MSNFTLEIKPFITHTAVAASGEDEEQCIHVSEAIAAQGIDDVTKKKILIVLKQNKKHDVFRFQEATTKNFCSRPQNF
uniref:Uncharacterized protein n=1 Tax=Panagrolaimus sp. PS1159 TaxID=55785 RepID=A0AC35FPX2_9BILA